MTTELSTSTKEESSPQRPRTRVSVIGWITIFLLGSLLILTTTALWLFAQMRQELHSGVRGVVDAMDKVGDFVEKLRPELTTQTFVTWQGMNHVKAEGGKLEVASAEETVTLQNRDIVTIFGKEIPGTGSISEIRAPATYHYHIDINGTWDIQTDGRRVVVRAPRIAPTLPIAFDTARLEKKTDKGWLVWTSRDESLTSLEKSITSRLEEKSKSPDAIAQVREKARMAVARFVRDWLLARQAWGSDPNLYDEILVSFEDEPPISDVLPPILHIPKSSEVQP